MTTPTLMEAHKAAVEAEADPCPECGAPLGTCWSQSGSMGQHPSCYRDPTVAYTIADWRTLCSENEAEMERLRAENADLQKRWGNANARIQALYEERDDLVNEGIALRAMVSAYTFDTEAAVERVARSQCRLTCGDMGEPPCFEIVDDVKCAECKSGCGTRARAALRAMMEG